MPVPPHALCGVSAMRKLLSFLLSAFLLTVSFSPVLVSAAGINSNSTGLQTTGDEVFGKSGAAALDLPTFIGKYIITPVVGLLGLLFFCLTIYAGFLWMTAAGDDKKVAQAKSILTAAVIGAAIVLASYAITDFVFTQLGAA
jgi:hypothetical protein